MLACIAVAAFIWFAILFLDVIFKTCMFHPYLSALQACGINVKPLYISITLTHFNRSVNQMGRNRPQILKIWFDTGVCAAAAIFFPSLILYFISMSQMLKSSTAQDDSRLLLMPVIPGYNVPSSHFLYYIVVVLFCSVVHEFGHALAASREQVSVESFGFAVFGIFSFAFVNLRSDQMKQLSYWSKLRILCAGIWHNIVLVLIGFLFWYLAFIFLAPLYHVGNGVSILKINQMSGLNHPAGFELGDHLYNVENCQISNSQSWQACLQHLKGSPSQGFCIPHSLTITKNSNKEQLCFNSSEYLNFQSINMKKDVCLKAREVINSFKRCQLPSNCDRDFICAFPILPENHHLIAINRHHKPSVLYAGTIDDLNLDVFVSDFVPKFKVLSASFAESVINFLQYIIMFSSGLAVLNVLPFFFHDGTYIVENFVHLCFENFISSYNKRCYIIQIINRIGLIMLVGLVLCFIKYYTFHHL